MDRFDLIRTFTRVVEARGFAAAARGMGVSRSLVSKQVMRLEDELGTALLHRSTRHVTPTEVGQAFYERCLDLIGQLDETVRTVRAGQGIAGGTLRVNAPMSFGTLHLSGMVTEYMHRNPGVHVDLLLDDRFLDPIEEGFDVTVRIGEPPVSTSLVVREVVRSRRVLCASPGYLEGRGEPAHPQALRSHRCLHYGYLASGNRWRLDGPEGEHSYAVHCVLRSNNAEVLLAAACAGQGIALLPTFIAGEALRDGALRTVLDAYRPPPAALCVLYPRHRHLPSTLREFVALLVDTFDGAPYWDAVDEDGE